MRSASGERSQPVRIVWGFALPDGTPCRGDIYNRTLLKVGEAVCAQGVAGVGGEKRMVGGNNKALPERFRAELANVIHSTDDSD